MKLKELTAPLAITMWDFSWLERRWSGAGYEDWDLALDELTERGYNAVRIDAYPLLVSIDAKAEWTVKPCWNQQDWGTPARNRVQVQPNLNTFIRKCAQRGILVGLSTWFQRVEETNVAQIVSPQCHSRIWKDLLDSIASDNLLDSILYLDFCNEWPLDCWAPFFLPAPTEKADWNSPSSIRWMVSSINELRLSYPNIAYTYSNIGHLNLAKEDHKTVSETFDLLEPHIWMAQANSHEFYTRVDYHYERFESKGYENVVLNAQRFYEADSDYWDDHLKTHIDEVCIESEALNLPLITTECWGIVDYKDWPMLDWEWVKRSCEVGVRHAASKGRWAAIATSNFCGPQFRGMWRDKDWHQEMTKIICSAKLPG
ncbi:cellulase-like family protein [Coraliomargarita algicola]|uniref:Cellulase-like family protein n=1 Tax=Coraliomargarita algicola TaxID=3092156 RepID=A0ABZ0RJY3_9BACT|nr:cellulase-like family protein [Coraliomargarita sp. J2-16]WPJ95847.1 cellulase-like family protein [Coraliomargarita sp. J2-16]